MIATEASKHLSVTLRWRRTKRRRLTPPRPGVLTLTTLWGFWDFACISCWESPLSPPSATLSAGESSASYRWILACVSESYDMWVSGCVRACEHQYAHTLWTQNTELHFSRAGRCITHKNLAESLHPVYWRSQLEEWDCGSFFKQFPVVLALWFPKQSVQQLFLHAHVCTCACFYRNYQITDCVLNAFQMNFL